MSTNNLFLLISNDISVLQAILIGSCSSVLRTCSKFSFFTSITCKTDSTKTDEYEGQDDENSKHVLIWHDKYKAKFHKIKARVETSLNTANCSPLRLNHIFLDNLSY